MESPWSFSTPPPSENLGQSSLNSLKVGAQLTMRRPGVETGCESLHELFVEKCWHIECVFKMFLQSSPATTVTSPSSTPAKTIDTSPPVDLFATSSTAAPVR